MHALAILVVHDAMNIANDRRRGEPVPADHRHDRRSSPWTAVATVLRRLVRPAARVTSGDSTNAPSWI